MTFYDVDTSADRVYTDDLCREPRLVEFLSRVTVQGDESVPDTGAQIEARLDGAESVKAGHDLAARSAPETLVARPASQGGGPAWRGEREPIVERDVGPR